MTRELELKREQKQRRRAKKKAAIREHNFFKVNNPTVYREQKQSMLGKLVDFVVKTQYPKYQCKIVLE